MSEFIWSAGHLGWGFFLLLVYSGVCCLVGDLVWRLVTVKMHKLLAVFGGCWLAGVALLLIGTCSIGQ